MLGLGMHSVDNQLVYSLYETTSQKDTKQLANAEISLSAQS